MVGSLPLGPRPSGRLCLLYDTNVSLTIGGATGDRLADAETGRPRGTAADRGRAAADGATRDACCGCARSGRRPAFPAAGAVLLRTKESSCWRHAVPGGPVRRAGYGARFREPAGQTPGELARRHRGHPDEALPPTKKDAPSPSSTRPTWPSRCRSGAGGRGPSSRTPAR